LGIEVAAAIAISIVVTANSEKTPCALSERGLHIVVLVWLPAVGLPPTRALGETR
jgi:hypothetical protein